MKAHLCVFVVSYFNKVWGCSLDLNMQFEINKAFILPITHPTYI